MNNLSCAVVITSYNKAVFVSATIESALAQDYPKTKIVVIDDGSKDNSLAVIERYRGRVTIVAKPNGGQASAFNVAIGQCQEDIIFFLDCDDTLLPDTVSRVVAAWRPGMSKVHFKLQRMLEDGTPIANSVLPPYETLQTGDLTDMLRRYSFYPSPPTSGNAFSRDFLRSVYPIPEEDYRSSADTFLIGLAPIYGKIGALASIGGYWRLTGQNNSSGGLTMLSKMVHSETEYVAWLQARSGQTGKPHVYKGKWPQHLKNLLVLRKFEEVPSERYPSLRSVAWSYLRTVTSWPGYRFSVRLKFLVWGLAMGLLPVRLLRHVPGIAGPSIDVSQH